MSWLFGISLGNSSACLALCKDGKVDVLANDSGDRVTPAYVAFNGMETVVGIPAKAGMFRNSSTTITRNKRLMNEELDEEEFNDIKNSLLIDIKKDNNVIKYVIKIDDKLYSYTPEQISSILFAKLFTIANSLVRSDTDLPRTVVCVPFDCSLSSRQAVKRSAEGAGFEVLQVITEPGAAVHAYLHDAEEDCNVLVYRLGGTTCDATVFQYASGFYVDRGYAHDPHLGGDKFTDLLAEYMAQEFKQKWKLDPKESRRSMSKLRCAAETCKHVLSTMSTAHCFAESVCDGVDLSYNITRARFESLVSPCVQDYVVPVTKALEQAKLNNSSINKVVLCGGSMKIPKLQQMLADLFPEAEVLSKYSPDEVIAMGAARQAGCLPRAIDPACDLLRTDVECLKHAFYVKVQDTMRCVLSENTPFPVEVKRTWQVHLKEPRESQVEFELHRKQTAGAETSQCFGKVVLSQVVVPTDVSLQAAVDSFGNLNLVFTDTQTKRSVSWKQEEQNVV